MKVVPMADGYSVRFFMCGRVEVMVEGFEDEGVPAKAIDAFVEQLIAEAC